MRATPTAMMFYSFRKSVKQHPHTTMACNIPWTIGMEIINNIGNISGFLNLIIE
jgi:hypothetical protein